MMMLCILCWSLIVSLSENVDADEKIEEREKEGRWNRGEKSEEEKGEKTDSWDEPPKDTTLA